MTIRVHATTITTAPGASDDRVPSQQGKLQGTPHMSCESSTARKKKINYTAAKQKENKNSRTKIKRGGASIHGDSPPQRTKTKWHMSATPHPPQPHNTQTQQAFGRG